MPVPYPLVITSPIDVDGDITHYNDGGRYKGNPSPVKVATAGQALTAGQFVCVKWVAGPNNYQVFVASSNETATWACGYVIADVQSNGAAFVHYGGINDKAIIANPTGTSVGAVWLGLNGTATTTPPPEVFGTLSQRIGTLANTNQILFEPESPIALQNAIGGKVIPVVYSSSLGMLREVAPIDVLPSNVVGSQGPQGFQGPTGVGTQGPQGTVGAQGPTGVGTQGPQGVAGTAGATGGTGPQGPAGTPAPTGTYVLKSGDTMTGALTSPRTIVTGCANSIYNGSATFEIQSAGAGHGAFAAYHIPGAYASYMGLDSDAVWRVGGWSAGAASWRLVHEGLTSVALPGKLTVGGIAPTAGYAVTIAGSTHTTGNFVASNDVMSTGRLIAGVYDPYNTHIFNVRVGGAGALPATGGSTDGGLVARFDTSNVVLDFGNSHTPPYSSWIQNRQGANLAAVGYLMLNPNGGYVSINSRDTPLKPLDVKTAANQHFCAFTAGGGLAAIGYLGDGAVGWNEFYIQGNTVVAPLYDATSSSGYSGRRWTGIWATSGVVSASDARAKTEVADSDLGLDFINTLRPVSYKWIVGKNVVTQEVDHDAPQPPPMEGAEPPEPQVIYKDVLVPVPGVRTHYGLIAQEVATAVKASGAVDFGGYIDPSFEKNADPNAELGLRYDEFISPMIKAIQELSARVVALEAQLAQRSR